MKIIRPFKLIASFSDLSDKQFSTIILNGL